MRGFPEAPHSTERCKGTYFFATLQVFRIYFYFFAIFFGLSRLLYSSGASSSLRASVICLSERRLFSTAPA